MKMINITPGVCGNNDHIYTLAGQEEGGFEFNGTWYFYHGGCPLCVDEKIKEILKED